MDGLLALALGLLLVVVVVDRFGAGIGSFFVTATAALYKDRYIE